MKVLRQAVDAGLTNAAAIRRDPDMKQLLARDDFRKMVEEVAKRDRSRPK